MFEFGMQIAFDLLGMFAFATSGALMAIRKDFDAIGILLLAELTATGGGVMRDLIIGATPPASKPTPAPRFAVAEYFEIYPGAHSLTTRTGLSLVRGSACTTRDDRRRTRPCFDMMQGRR
jgi:hypothetical protein